MEDIVGKVLGIVVLCFLFAALVPTVLLSFTNLSNSGIALGAIFGTIMGLIFAVFILRTLLKTLR